jgi:serine/threonine protein kinase
MIVGDQEPGQVQIKIADFAFSCFGLPDDGPRKVSRTEPWDAPEWYDGRFFFKDVKKMDIYSFGLLFLWLFFRYELMDELGPDTTVSSAFSGQDQMEMAKPQALKQDGDALLDCELGLVKQSHDLDEDVRNHLL